MVEHGYKVSFKSLESNFNIMRDAKENLKTSEATREYDAGLSAITANIAEITKKAGVKELLATEEFCLKYEAKYLVNSKEQADSLKTALAQVPAAQKAVESIKNKLNYKVVAIESFGKKAKCRDGLPNDGAREFFSSQKSRLNTLSKGWGSDAEKALFDARHKMLDTAEKTYASEQRRALGLEEEKSKPATKEAAPEKTIQHLAHEKIFKELMANLPPDKQEQALEYFNKQYLERSKHKEPAQVAMLADKEKVPEQASGQKSGQVSEQVSEQEFGRPDRDACKDRER